MHRCLRDSTVGNTRQFDQLQEEQMSKKIRRSAIALAVMTFAAGSALAGPVQVKLRGDQEVPPGQTSPLGRGTITIKEDKTGNGSGTNTRVKRTMAHIHEGPAGQNGGGP